MSICGPLIPADSRTRPTFFGANSCASQPVNAPAAVTVLRGYINLTVHGAAHFRERANLDLLIPAVLVERPIDGKTRDLEPAPDCLKRLAYAVDGMR